MRRVVVAVVLVSLLAPTAVSAVLAAPNGTTTATPSPTATPAPTPTATPTATPTPTPTPTDTSDAEADQWTYAELTERGTRHAEAPPSMRFLGDYGSLTLRYDPVSPVAAESWKYLEPGTTVVHHNDITLRAVRLAPAGEFDENVTVKVVAWEQGTRVVERGNKTTTEPEAQNVTVLTQQVSLGRGYSSATIDLPSSYRDTQQITMWIKGEPDARWVFEHRSIPSSRPVDIDTTSDALGYAATYVLLPGAIGVLVGIILARLTLKRTGTGPRYGLVLWGLMLGIGGMMLVAAAWFKLAVILANAQWITGTSLGLLAYAVALTMHDDVEKVAFERLELKQARALRNYDAGGDDPDVAADGGQHGRDVAIAADDYHEELYRDLPSIPVVRTGDGLTVPKRGIRPFFARLFADAAELDLSTLRTRVRVEQGGISEIVMVDPESDEPYWHSPARLVRRIPGWDTLSDDATGAERYLGLAIGAAVVLGIPAAGAWVGGQTLGLPVVGAIAALPVLAWQCYTAADGTIDFEPAPIHMQAARATITVLQQEYAEGAFAEEIEEELWDERATTALEARDIEQRRDETLNKRLNDATLGFGAAQDEQPATVNGHDPIEDDEDGGDDDE